MGYVNVLGTRASDGDAWHDMVARRQTATAVSTVLQLHGCIYAESSRRRQARGEEAAANTLEALSVFFICAVLEPSHVDLIGCID